MKNLIKFDELAKEAGLSGTQIPENLAKGISSNSISAEAAIESLKQVAAFDSSETVKNATEAGIEIPESLRKGIASGKLSVDEAMKRLGDLTSLNEAVKNAGFELEIIPGITSFCAAADKAQISLCEGNESVAIIPSLKSNLLEKYIADFDTVVIMKSGNDTDVIYDILKKYRLENNAIVSSCIGMENEIIEKIQKGKSYGYFTTVIVRK